MPFLAHYQNFDKQHFLDTLEERGFTVKPWTGGLLLIDYPKDDTEAGVLDALAELGKHFLNHLKLAYVPNEEFLQDQENLVRTVLNLRSFRQVLEEFLVSQRQALLDSLYVVFQPIIDIVHYEVHAFEALCRGQIPIQDLMKYARSILDLIDWTCKEKALAVKKREFPEEKIKLFLNFFPEALKNVKVASEKLFELLAKYKIQPTEVVVEITEYAGFNLKELKSLVKEWRELGIKIALDDVGRGEESLFRFLEIMPDYIKVDMVFIRDIHLNKVKRDITRYLINLAHANDILVVAEGVEKPEELRVVHQLGADMVQGFLFGKPTENPRAFLHTPIAHRLRELL